MNTATLVKAKHLHKLAEPDPLPMTADEALEALTTMNRYVIDWSRSLLEFAQRDGWKALGYVTLRDCLGAKLRVGAEAAMCVLRAAQMREELAALAGDQRLRERIFGMPDSQTLVLNRLDKPGEQLKAMRVAVGHDCSMRVTAKSLSLTVGRMVGSRPVERRPRRERCPSCNGTGFIAQGRVVPAAA